jgi:hypothetical protein
LLRSVSGALQFIVPMAEAGLVIDLGSQGPIVLQSGTAGQSVDVFVRNDGPAIAVGGLDLRIGLIGNLSPAPAITSVTLQSGPLFTAVNAAQAADANNGPQAQFWSVSINDPSAPPTLSGGGVLTRIGTLTLSTTGVGIGSWTLLLSLPETSFSDPIGNPLPLSVMDGTLQVVPEPSVAASVAAMAMLAFALVRRIPRRRASGSVGNTP